MDENHQDWVNHKQVTTENKIWLPPSYNKNKPPSAHPAPKKRGINWGSAHRSFWEWLLLLGTLLAALGAIAIPFVVTILGLNFTQQQAQLSMAASERQHQTDLQIARDQQQASTLQTYIDNIQDLLLNHNLPQARPNDIVALLAGARTLAALQGLDPERKRRLLLFLYDANLIGAYRPLGDWHSVYHRPIIDMSGADLSEIDLYNTDLSGADLSATNLSRANLKWATFDGTNLHNTFLEGDSLIGEHGAQAINLTQQQLNQTSRVDMSIPDGLTCQSHL